MFYPYSENKDADQLRGYREADLRLCFRIYKNPVFSRRGSFKGCLKFKNSYGRLKCSDVLIDFFIVSAILMFVSSEFKKKIGIKMSDF